MANLVLDQINKTLGGRSVIHDLTMTVGSGEFVSLLGPSGSGKTTTLRMIGGFISNDAGHGRILIDGRDVSAIPPERRPTAMVFQQYALWPNMTVFQNIAFGLQIRRLAKAVIKQRVAQVLTLVDLIGHDRKYPAQLSGGQQQRVALARALVLEPQVLLLDEPLSNLDAQLRVKVREDIRSIQQKAGITTVFVTHDQDEAMSVSDRVAVLNDGKIEQFDTPETLYTKPATEFVARFIGSMNFLEGVPQAEEIIMSDGSKIPCGHVSAVRDTKLVLAVRPESVRIAEQGVPARVTRRVPRGHYVELVLENRSGSLRAFAPSSAQISENVHYVFDSALVYDQGKLAHV